MFIEAFLSQHSRPPNARSKSHLWQFKDMDTYFGFSVTESAIFRNILRQLGSKDKATETSPMKMMTAVATLKVRLDMMTLESQPQALEVLMMYAIRMRAGMLIATARQFCRKNVLYCISLIISRTRLCILKRKENQIQSRAIVNLTLGTALVTSAEEVCRNCK